MAKLKKSGIKKVDLLDIILKGNVRKTYDEIEERARSIEREGLLQPVIIDNENNLIAGYCRYKAHELLVSEGKPYNQIECVVRTGDFHIIQLTENIQRSDLKPAELEAGLKKMLDSGMTKTEIADRLNKRLTWVSDALAAGSVREKTTEDTSGISTGAMSSMRAVPDEKLGGVIEETIATGGTVRAAKEAVKKATRPPDNKVDRFSFDVGSTFSITDSTTDIIYSLGELGGASGICDMLNKLWEGKK